MEDKTILNSADIDRELNQYSGWTREDITLKKTFVFENYRDITSFLGHLVKTITDQNHHPDFSLDNGSRSIPVAISTHSAKAVTQADLLFVETLEKWKPASRFKPLSDFHDGASE